MHVSIVTKSFFYIYIEKERESSHKLHGFVFV
jgi:hypothetical protein